MTTAPFDSLAGFAAHLATLPGPDADSARRAMARNMQLTKPPAALGRLEEIAIWYASWRGTDRPAVTAPQICVFAGNHGVAARGVSAFPAEVTVQMVANFAAGGAAINQLAKAFGARLDVTTLDLDQPTQDFTAGPALTAEECVAALQAGWDAVDPASDVLVPGEMGIANTTSAAALGAALLGGTPADWTGRGTGVDDAGLALKTQVVADGLALHLPQADGQPLELLRRLGGREIAAMAGAIAAARAHRIPVILDGFICSAAAAVLFALDPNHLAHVQAGHQSAEGAHARMLDAFGLTPMLSLGLRLGEGSGGAAALGVLKAAIACHSGMATFAEAGVSDG